MAEAFPTRKGGPSAGFDKQTKKVPLVDKIFCIAFKIARDEFCQWDGKEELFSRKWVAEKLKRSEDFVKRNWNTYPYGPIAGDFSTTNRCCSGGTRWTNRVLTRDF